MLSPTGALALVAKPVAVFRGRKEALPRLAVVWSSSRLRGCTMDAPESPASGTATWSPASEDESTVQKSRSEGQSSKECRRRQRGDRLASALGKTGLHKPLEPDATAHNHLRSEPVAKLR